MMRGTYFKKPLIVLDGGCMAMRTHRLGLGEVLGDLQPKTISSSIERLLQSHQWKDREGFLKIHARERSEIIIRQQYAEAKRYNEK